jgi:hypothetical protein
MGIHSRAIVAMEHDISMMGKVLRIALTFAIVLRQAVAALGGGARRGGQKKSCGIGWLSFVSR